MAIVKMKKVSLMGLQDDKSQIIDSLMKMGTVEIINIHDGISEEDKDNLFNIDGNDDEVSKIENQLSDVKSVIDTLAAYGTRKKGLFEPKRLIDYGTYNKVGHNKEKLYQKIEEIKEYKEQISNLQTEENKNLNLIDSLGPWKALDIPLDLECTTLTKVLIGTVPSIVDPYKLRKDLSEGAQAVHMDVIGSDKDQIYVFIIFHKDFEEQAVRILKQNGFTNVRFKEMKGTVNENIINLNNKIKDIKKERGKILKSISDLAYIKPDLEILYDYLTIQRDTIRILSKIGRTDSVFILEGWVPENESEKVKKVIIQKWECIFDLKDAEKEEEYPVLLKNPSIVKPFELITDMYSVPSSKGIDPNIIMAPFFFIFFGLMVSDAGYGLIMATLSGILLLKFKLEGLTHKLIKLIFLGGISTFLWGIMFGGWFGDIVQVVSQGKFAIPPLWFNPLDDPMRLLIWSFIFGGIQLYTGMGLMGYRLIKDGKPLDALFDIGFWYVFLSGLVLMLVGGASVSQAGKYMALTGAVLLVLTQGRKEKSIVKKLLTGILSLYNAVGFLSDVLSYSRLLALGLATGVIASVINTIGSLFGFSPIGIVILIIVFIGGHLFNILINALGAYVHSSRLQYVEFFSKFYEGGGKTYQPFKINTKYIELNNRRAE